MNDWNQQQGTSGQNHNKGYGGEFGGSGPCNSGAWVWLRWSDKAPENIRQGLNNTGFKSWHCKTGDWNCKFWVPASSEAEAKKKFEAKFGNKDYITETKFEWNWSQSAAA